MYEVYVGCEEWQEITKFETLEKAREAVADWKKIGFTMGLYTAEDCWIENEDSGFYEAIEIR